MLRYRNLLLVLLVTFVSLSGCSAGVKKTLGLTRNSPDEFAVISHAPLQIPSSFSLADPESDQFRSEIKQVQNKQMIFKEKNPYKYESDIDRYISQSDHYTKEESYIKDELHLSPQDSNVRDLIDSDYEKSITQEKTFLQKLMTLSGDEIEQDPIIDPALERQRIINQQRQGSVIRGSEAEIQDNNDDRGIFNKMLGM